ncbi:hypothetical protein NDU88_002446 [Pleurodeles waltl]|uniref:Uncharacterized protein n=1 Tax=Pleurodeles waltl TaxID=8319 RepID=A0AAV7LCI1_PLEWA|nr:hypothetical protein NDU88_002446 [Pleurodeles waltl]
MFRRSGKPDKTEAQKQSNLRSASSAVHVTLTSGAPPVLLPSTSSGRAQESCLHGFVRCIASEMEIVSFCFSLGLTFLAVAWRSKVMAVLPGYQGTCKLIHRAADCNRKHLTSVPQDLPGITEELFLDFNEVRTLTNSSLLRYIRMWSLSLSQNNVELIEPGTFLVSKRLSVLNLQGNCVYVNYTVTAAALRGVPTLRKLDLSKNYLTEDMATTLLQNLSTLESLSLARNVLMRLDSMTFADLVELRELSLERNYIYEIEAGTFEAMQRLQRLNLAYNQITCIVGFRLTQVRVLNISYNSIEWFLSDESSNEFDLETLDLSSNQLLFFPLLPKRNKLRSLLLSDNRMNFYEKRYNATLVKDGTVKFIVISNNVTNVTAVNIWEDITVGNVSSLNFLDMSKNEFWYLPEGFLAMMTSLSQLKLNHNCFQSIHLTELEPPGSLVELDLSQNQLLELRVDPDSNNVLPNLRTLNVSTNKLNMLPAQLFNHMKYITTVDLSYNHLDLCPRIVQTDKGEDQVCTDFRNIISLKHLYLAGSVALIVYEQGHRRFTIQELILPSGGPNTLQKTVRQVGAILEEGIAAGTGAEHRERQKPRA